jgi:hypothetical protein
VEPAGGQGCLYDDAHAGHERIRRMRRMARTGRGLSTYISREIRGDYAERLHWWRAILVRMYAPRWHASAWLSM